MPKALTSNWDLQASSYARILMKPFSFQDLKITVLDVVPARHAETFIVDKHNHGWFEFNFISDGALYTTFFDEAANRSAEFLAKSGSMFLIPPYLPHTNRGCAGEGDDGFCLRFALEKAPLPLDGVEPLADRLIEALSRPVARAIPFMGAAALLDMSDRSFDVVSLQANTVRWLISLSKALQEAQGVSPIGAANERGSLAEAVMIYLTCNYNQPITVKALADMMFLSYRHLARLFKQEKGLTIMEMLQQIRIAKAKPMLAQTKRSIREISAETGFRSEYYFSTVFKQVAGMTPTQYRRARQRQ